MHWWTTARFYLGARWRFLRLRGPALEHFQDRRAQRIVAYAVRHASFYRDHFAGRDLTSWRTLPTTDKMAMMSHFDTFNSAGVQRSTAVDVAVRAEMTREFLPTIDGLTVGLSSGTSGHRGVFLVSPREQAGWAGTLLARTLPSLRRRGFRIAFFLRSNSRLYESVGGRWISFRYFDPMMPLDQAVAQLNEAQPDFLVGPPSVLGLLADARLAGDLRISPERVVSVAEVLEAQEQERLATAFEAPVHQIYQCTEGLLGVSCAQGRLHLQEDMTAVQLEPLAEDCPNDSGCEAEQRLTPIVTDLWRQTQPIIRYRLNDVVTVDPRPCACGSAFRVLGRIEGRRDDICYFEAVAGGRRPFFSDTIRRMILLSSPHILDYQAFQERLGHLRVHLQTPPEVPFGEVARAVQAEVLQTVAQYGCRPPAVVVERDLIQLSRDHKRRRVQRLG